MIKMAMTTGDERQWGCQSMRVAVPPIVQRNQASLLAPRTLFKHTLSHPPTQACQMNGMKLMGRDVGVDMAKGGAGSRDVKPVDGCWFCLSNPNCSSWLVVSIGQARERERGGGGGGGSCRTRTRYAMACAV